jgi:transcriptional regulator with XRE-family HTH domain
MATTPTRVPLADAARRAIQESELSFNELGKLAGVSPGQLSRFANGERDLTVAVVSRVCLALGYELIRTGEVITAPLSDPPLSNRKRPKDRPRPASAFSRGQGMRIDLEPTEQTPQKKPKGKAGLATRQSSVMKTGEISTQPDREKEKPLRRKKP